MTLRTRLDDLAADAPDPGTLDFDRLHGRIVRRRRTRLAAGGAAVVLVATAASVAAVGLLDQDASPPVAGETSPTLSEQQEFRFGECGDPITTRGPAPDGPLTMTIELSEPTPVGGDGISLGTMTVTNVGDETIAGTTGDGPGVVLAEPGGGRVTAQAPVHAVLRTVKLEPGESATYDVVLYRYRCVPGQPVDMPSGSVPLDRPYEAYVTWGMTTGDGADVTLYGGPFDVEL